MCSVFVFLCQKTLSLSLYLSFFRHGPGQCCCLECVLIELVNVFNITITSKLIEHNNTDLFV